MKNGETWTPICVPGCSEDFMLHVYVHYTALNLGMVLVCTDHNVFEACHEYSERVWEELQTPQKKFYAGANKPSLQNVVDRCTMSMFTNNDLKEVQLVILRNNRNCQYTTYNYPLLTKVNARHQQFLRIFESMYARSKMDKLFDAEIKPLPTEGKTEVRVIGKYVQTEFTLAMVHYKVSPSDFDDRKVDMTLFIVYDHRLNNKLENIAKFLMGDILRDEKNLFFDII